MRKPTVLLLVVVLAVAVVAWFALRPTPPPASLAAEPPASGSPPVQPAPSATAVSDAVANAEGIPGSSASVGCGDELWSHVYKPERLRVKQDCLTVTGVIVDATATLSHPRRDGVRKEPDGDTHGWLKVDPEFANLLDAGNDSDEGGNLVFEIVCHWKPTQADAKAACQDYKSPVVFPPVGTHVAITGTFVRDTHHGEWNEIHPVSRIEVK
jgi:hypothetical protein